MRYSWKCEKCDKITVLSMSFADYDQMRHDMENGGTAIPLCKSCGSPKLVRTYTPTLVIYNAKGFYSTGG